MEPSRHALIDAPSQRGDRILGGLEDCFLQDVIEIDEPAPVMLENGDRSATVGLRPKLGATRGLRCSTWYASRSSCARVSGAFAARMNAGGDMTVPTFFRSDYFSFPQPAVPAGTITHAQCSAASNVLRKSDRCKHNARVHGYEDAVRTSSAIILICPFVPGGFSLSVI